MGRLAKGAWASRSLSRGDGDLAVRVAGDGNGFFVSKTGVLERVQVPEVARLLGENGATRQTFDDKGVVFAEE